MRGIWERRAQIGVSVIIRRWTEAAAEGLWPLGCGGCRSLLVLAVDSSYCLPRHLVGFQRCWRLLVFGGNVNGGSVVSGSGGCGLVLVSTS